MKCVWRQLVLSFIYLKLNWLTKESVKIFIRKNELKLISFVRVALQVFIATWLLCQIKVKPVIDFTVNCSQSH